MGILNPTGYKRKKLNQNYNNYQATENYYWTPSTIRNILKNDIYIGNVTQGKRRVKSYKIHKIENVPKEEWITVENMHEPIIEKELFEKVQKINNEDTRVNNKGELNKFAGLLKCAECKMAMNKKSSKNKSNKIYEYYICGTYRKKSNKLCTKHTIKAEELEKAVLEIINMEIKKNSNIDKVLLNFTKIQESKTKKIGIEKIKKVKIGEIEKINKLKKSLYEDWKNEFITKEEYLEYKEEYNIDIQQREIAIKSIEEVNKKHEDNIHEKNKWINNLKKYRNIIELDREVVIELIDKIEVHEKNKITIYFNFESSTKISKFAK